MVRDNYNAKRVTGIFAGILLCAIWFFVVFNLEGILFTHNPMNFQNPLTSWVYVGPVPLFIMTSSFVFTRTCLPEAEQQDLLALKGMVVGFLVWSVFIVILLSGWTGVEGQGFITTTGGFVFMLVLVMIFQGKIPLSGGKTA
jgi:hypothetical protein